MITEAITISIILGGCATAAWFAKTKFQPEIDRSLTKIEAKEEAVVARHRPSHID
jgi:hypothetical protein